MGNFKHGLSQSRTYNSWRSMIQRCKNPNHKSYDYYKNFEICKEWINSFNAFLEDMGERPSRKTLDRIDNGRGYFKENCRWSSLTIQNSNKRPWSNSGHMNISISHANGYKYHKVDIKRGELHVIKTFREIEDAITFRDEKLREYETKRMIDV